MLLFKLFSFIIYLYSVIHTVKSNNKNNPQTTRTTIMLCIDIVVMLLFKLFSFNSTSCKPHKTAHLSSCPLVFLSSRLLVLLSSPLCIVHYELCIIKIP